MVRTDSVKSNERVSDLMTPKVVKPIESFLQSFERTIAADGGNLTPKLLADFLAAADRLNNQCSQNVAWLLLDQSDRPDVRASSEGTMVRMVRSRCFETSDQILENFAAYLAQLSLDLRATIQALTESRLRNALTGIEAPTGEKVKRFKLPIAARASAVVKMFDYFQHLQVAAKALAEYGCRRLVTNGDEEAARASAVVQAALEEPFRRVLQLLENHQVIRRKRWEEEVASESAVLNTIVASSGGKMETRKSTAGSIALSVLFAVPVWYTSVSGTNNLYVGIATAACAILAMACVLRTINVMVK